MRRWLRFKLRKFIKPPKDLARAALIRRRLAGCYLFVAWNTLGIFIYYHLKEEYPMTQSEKKVPALWYLRLMGEDQVDVITIDGFTKTSHIHFDATTDTITPANTDTVFKSIYTAEEAPELDS